MHLKKLYYSEWEDTPQEWTLEDLELGQKNLLVGRNASGKSRTLNVIHALARNLSGIQQLPRSGKYKCLFECDNKNYNYYIYYEDQKVVEERIEIDGHVKLDRGEGGVGKIYYENIKGAGESLDFQVPTKDVAAVVKRDAIQHSFIEPLYLWASSLRYYPFGTPLGKGSFLINIPNGPDVDERDHQAVVSIFQKGQKDFGDEYVDLIKSDMSKVGYFIEDLNLSSPFSITFSGLPGDPIGLFVKESGLPGITDQHSMSQGMFRVLSLLVQCNYFLFKKSASTLLIDDIGEGLDFSRSCELINLLRSKAEQSEIQIVMATNDRFVMNKIPLDEWSILQRQANHVYVKNYQNSKDKFDEFKFTGLSNFSMLEFDYLNS